MPREPRLPRHLGRSPLTRDVRTHLRYRIVPTSGKATGRLCIRGPVTMNNPTTYFESFRSALSARPDAADIHLAFAASEARSMRLVRGRALRKLAKCDRKAHRASVNASLWVSHQCESSASWIWGLMLNQSPGKL